MSDTTPIPAASERERFEAWDSAQFEIDAEVYSHKHGERYVDRAVQCRWECWQARAALSHPGTPQGWKQIGWTCGEGDCGRIHEAPGAEGSYAVPVYVQCPPEQGGKG